MKKKIIIILVVALSCSWKGGPLKKIDRSNLVIVVPEEIVLNKDVMYASLFRTTQNSMIPSGWGLEIIVLGYSTGKEVFSLSGESGDVTNRIDRGKLSALVKIRDRQKLKKFYFVDSSGASEEEMFEVLAREIRKRIDP